MVLVMLLAGAASILWAERLMVNNGLGWDGVRYGAWAKHFPQNFFVEGVPEYYVQRILPGAAVHYARRALLTPFYRGEAKTAVMEDDRNVILSFDIYNLALLLVAVYTWGLIADLWGLSDRAKWLGFCLLFVNFSVLKHTFYHSVLTDTTAFALGILSFYFFLADKPLGQLAVIVAGCFTWPTIPYMSALLYVFPAERRAADATPSVETARGAERRWATVAAAALALVALAALLYLTTKDFPERTGYYGRVLRVDLGLVYLSVAAVPVYLFFCLREAFADGRLFDYAQTLRALRWRRAALVVVVLAAMKLFTKLMAGRESIGHWGGLREFAGYTFLSALTEPLVFLVAHAVYFGVGVLLVAFFWKPLCESVRGYGVGLRWFLILTALLSINSQSRFMVNAVPVLLMLLVKMLDARGLAWRRVALLAALALLYSKVWYTFNTAPQVDDGTLEVLLRFPLQHYFANSGSWMSAEMYYAQGGVILATCAVLYFVLVRRTRGRAARAAAGAARA